jgi:GDPmannose 4,6-dehydratase
VVATGESHSVLEFLESAFRYLGLNWSEHVEIDPRYFRPAEVDHLLGDATKARERLGWQPTVDFAVLVKMMVDGDIEHARQERTLRDAGHSEGVRGGTRD